MYKDQPTSVVILADTSGTLHPKIAELVTQCDMAVHAGNVGSAQVLRQLKPRGEAVFAVRGPEDVPSAWPEEDHKVLASLRPHVTVDLPGGQLACLYGHEAERHILHAGLRDRFPDAHAIVYGVGHEIITDQDVTPWVLNPGAATQDAASTCLLLLCGVTHWSVQHHSFD